MRVALASIHARTVPFTFMQARDRVVQELVEMDALGGIVSSTGPYVDINRNDCVEMFLKGPADYLLFLDDDMGFPPGVVARLLSAEADVVSGLYFQRGAGFYPQFYRYLGYYPGKYGEAAHHYQAMVEDVRAILAGRELDDGPVILSDVGCLPIDGGGCGCLLVRRKVLETLRAPWFYNERYLHEDFNFYRDVKAAGFQVVGDAGCVCGHFHTEIAGARSFLTGELGRGEPRAGTRDQDRRVDLEIAEAMRQRLTQLREAEGQAWAELHAIQGRVAECEQWVQAMAAPQTPAPATPAAEAPTEEARPDES